jgi:TolA-binding protein
MDIVQMEKQIQEMQSLKDSLLHQETQIIRVLNALKLQGDEVASELLRIDEAMKNASSEEAEWFESRKRELAKQQERILEAKKEVFDKIDNLRGRIMKLSEEISRLEKQIDSGQIAEQHNQSESRLEVTTNNEQASSELEALKNENRILTHSLARSNYRGRTRRSPEEMLALGEKHRRTNGKINFSAVAKDIGVTNKTAKRWYELALNLKK